MDAFALLAALIAVGVGIGVLSGLLGIGGGTVMVPVFRLVFGLEPIVCTATSLFTIIPTSVSGAVTHIRNKTCLLSLGVATGLGGACASPLGVYLAAVSPEVLVMAVAALVIGYSAASMLRKAAQAARQGRAAKVASAGSCGPATAGGAAAPYAPAAPDAPAAPGAPAAPSRRDIAVAVGVGLLAGVMSGYVGVGGGFLIVPLLMSLAGLPMRLASGTSLVAVMILAIPGTVEQGLLGNIDYVVGLATAVGSIPGAVVGAWLVRRVPELQLRVLFGCVLIVAAILLVANEVGALG